MMVRSLFFARVFKLTFCSFLLGLLMLAAGQNSFAQPTQLERRIPAPDITRVRILNADVVSVVRWGKDEVALTAETNLDSLVNSEIETKSGNHTVEISSHLSKPGKQVMLIVHVPKMTLVEIKNHRNSVEADETISPLGVEFTEGLLDLFLPNGVGCLLEDAWAPVNGLPYVRVKMSHQDTLLVSRDYTGPREFTTAAQTVARQNGVMGMSLRQSEPRLAKFVAERPAEDASIEDDGADIKLKGELVNLSVSVADREGKAVAHLRQDNFSVYEDGVEQPITHFSADDAPFNLVLLLDSSSSVKGKADVIKAAALHFLDVIRPQDNVAVVTFTSDVRVVSHLTNDREALRNSIKDMQLPEGNTSFYDALGYVLAGEFNKVKGQRNAVVVLSDGIDNSIGVPPPRRRGAPPPAGRNLQLLGSYLTFDQLLEGVVEAGALIYALHVNEDFGSGVPEIIGVGGIQANNGYVAVAAPGLGSEVEQIARDHLHELVKASGGRYYSADGLDAVKGMYTQVATDLRSVYGIGYVPNDDALDGKLRRIRVQVTRPEATVRTRRGYYPRR